MKERCEHSSNNSPCATRRAVLAAGAASLVVLAGGEHAAAAAPKTRTFSGISAKGSIQDALADALKQLDRALGEGGVRDASATWKLAEVIGQSGGIAGLNRVEVKIAAVRVPEWPAK